jgi:hypothetical protein
MTVFEKQYNPKDLVCKTDLTKKKTRCPACEKVKRCTRHSRSFPCPQTTWRHIHQCPNYKLISYPNRKVAVDALEEISLALRNNLPLEKTLGFRLGMIV